MVRPRLGKIVVNTRVCPETADTLRQAAKALGLTHTNTSGNREGSIGKLLDAIVKDFALFSSLKQIDKILVDDTGDNK